MKKQISKADEIDQVNVDDLADILWWIKGYHSASEDCYEQCDFKSSHIESLRRARVLMLNHLKDKQRRKK